MAQRPTSFPYWCTNNPSGLVQPPSADAAVGWQASEAPIAEYSNWLANTTCAWLQYLDDASNSAVLTNTLDHSMRLLTSGTFGFSLASGTLSWSAPLTLAIPTAADSANTIAAGSVTLPPGSVAYVQANVPFTTVATTTSGSVQLTNVVYGDNIAVGQAVAGAGIPAGATVQSVSSDGGTVTINNAATASATGVSLTFSNSGTLAVSVSSTQALVPGPNTVVLARATESSVIVGVGTGQMKLQDGETRYLLENGYTNVGRFTAGVAVGQLQAVYVSSGTADGRTAGSVYPTDAGSTYSTRAGAAGFAITAGAAAASVKVVQAGVVSGFSGLTPGLTYYLDPLNVGGITSMKPTAVGQMLCAVGQAVSATSMLLALTSPSIISGNISVPGTVTGASIVSGSGFKSVVYCGSYGTTSSSTSPSQLFFPLFSIAQGSVAYVPMSFSGSVVGLMASNSSPSNGTTLIVQKNGSTLNNANFNGTTVVGIAAMANGSQFYNQTFPRSALAFVAGDFLSVAFKANNSGQSIGINAWLVVEMPA